MRAAASRSNAAARSRRKPVTGRPRWHKLHDCPGMKPVHDERHTAEQLLFADTTASRFHMTARTSFAYSLHSTGGCEWRTPAQKCGENGNGKCCVEFPEASSSSGFCRNRVGKRPEIGPQVTSGDAGLSLNRQNKFGRHTLFGSGEPIPNLGLRGADPVGQGLLPSGDFTGALQCFGR